MEKFLCPFCKYEPISVEKHGQSLIFCVTCNIYWGESAEQIAETLKSPLLKHVFAPKIVYEEPMHTKIDKFWYTFSALLVLIAVFLI